jgi:hypothetical protein
VTGAEGPAAEAAGPSRPAAAAEGQPVSLDAKARKFEVEPAEFELRKEVVQLVMPYFLKANLFVWLFLVACLVIDVVMAWRGVAHTPLVTMQVLMALLGATTVQLGVLAVTIGNYLFPSRGKG